jgi:geranylgeranyl diphosphate synthase type II
MSSVSSARFIEYARRVRPRVEAALDGFTQFDEDCPVRLREAIRHSLLAPGKRLRPLLVLMSSEACGGEARVAIPAACAVEMVHTYSLIHDDLPAMDDDDLRRGLPSCHTKFGEATAILAGDALLALAFEVLANGTSPPENAARCCSELARAAGASNLVGGQVDDLAAQGAGGDLEQLARIHRRKTGAMFNVCLRLGGLVSGATNEQLTALNSYGEKLGLAFQIVDDILDLQGDEVSMGKRTGKDQALGKLTFTSLIGADESRRRAAELVAAACEALQLFGAAGSELDALARYVLERNQ